MKKNTEYKQLYKEEFKINKEVKKNKLYEIHNCKSRIN